ncbi:hypothetical protein [Gordonia malaquae]|uniref:hypothetical protein n=1 Tax=Gordonia malaquae TaxID=410332 RepID=UPI003019940E
MTDEPQFRFDMWATTRPDDPYYYTNWDNKDRITVVAATKQEAMRQAQTALGPAGRRRHWVFQTISVIDHRIPIQDGAQ